MARDALTSVHMCRAMGLEPLVLTPCIMDSSEQPFASLAAWLQRQQARIKDLAGPDPAARGGHRCAGALLHVTRSRLECSDTPGLASATQPCVSQAERWRIRGMVGARNRHILLLGCRT